MEDNQSFEIKLPQFEGPFDLLLFFIERDELDIYDIPITGITNDFLEYIHQLKVMNIEVASEFILVAATLMRIKAKMLLPRPELDEEGNTIDPRKDLIQQLIEYRKYKAILHELSEMEDDRMKQEKRGNIVAELKKIATEIENESVSVDVLAIKVKRASELITYCQNKLRSTEQEVNNIIKQMETKTTPNG